MSRRVTGTLAALLVGLGLTVAVQSPAQALTGYDRCEGWGLVCVFTEVNGGGTIYRLVGTPGQCIDMVGGGVNSADSYANRRAGNISHHIQFYDNFGCSGTLLKVAYYGGGPIPSGAEGNFAVFRTSRGTHRDRVNSVWFNNG